MGFYPVGALGKMFNVPIINMTNYAIGQLFTKVNFLEIFLAHTGLYGFLIIVVRWLRTEEYISKSIVGKTNQNHNNTAVGTTHRNWALCTGLLSRPLSQRLRHLYVRSRKHDREPVSRCQRGEPTADVGISFWKTVVAATHLPNIGNIALLNK